MLRRIYYKLVKNTHIGKYVEIRKGVSIGFNTYIDSFCVFTGNSKIGNNVTIRNACIIARGVEIGDYTFISPQAMFQNLDIGGKKIGGAKIGSHCFIGTNVTFKEGVYICNNVVIGSKSYVNRDIVEPGFYVGCPIRKIK